MKTTLDWKRNLNFRTFQRTSDLNNLSVKAFSLIKIVFLTLPLLKAWDGITHFQLPHTVTRVSKRREKGKFFNSLVWSSWQGEGGDLGSYRDALGLVLLLLRLQGQLYEELLQLFIAIINTKLLKAAKKKQKKNHCLYRWRYKQWEQQGYSESREIGFCEVFIY